MCAYTARESACIEEYSEHAMKRPNSVMTHVNNIQDWLDSQILRNEARDAGIVEFQKPRDFGAFKAVKNQEARGNARKCSCIPTTLLGRSSR